MKEALSMAIHIAALRIITFSGLICLLAVGCGKKKEAYKMDFASYHEALKRTENPESPFPAGSEHENRAIDGFIDFYKVYSIEAIRAGVRDLYADEAYFGDPFKAVTGIDEIETYFLKMAEPVKSCTFEVQNWERADNEFYFHWTMELVAKRAPARPVTALGISHVRFDASGKVIFQQDYWDSSALFDQLPVVGWFTRAVKRRLE